MEHFTDCECNCKKRHKSVQTAKCNRQRLKSEHQAGYNKNAASQQKANEKMCNIRVEGLVINLEYPV